MANPVALSDAIPSSSSILFTPVPLASVSVPSMSSPSLMLIDDESPDTSELTVSAVSNDTVIVLPVALVVIPDPPDTCNTSESKSIAIAVESSAAISRSCAVTCESTYVLIALADAKVSSDPDTLAVCQDVCFWLLRPCGSCGCLFHWYCGDGGCGLQS